MLTFAPVPLNPGGYIIGTGMQSRCQKGNRGWDVLSVQNGLLSCGQSLPRYGADGGYGDETVKAVTAFQIRHKLTADGWAGQRTQEQITLELWWPIQEEFDTPPGLGRGQLMAESSLLTGTHSQARKTDPSKVPLKPDANGNYFDNGCAQMASEYFEYAVAYNPKPALRHYAQHLVDTYRAYKAFGKVTDERRLWELVAGSWNRPAWTERLAKGLTLTQEQSDWIEAYIARTTKLMVIS